MFQRNKKLEEILEPFWLEAKTSTDYMRLFENLIVDAFPHTTFYFKDAPIEVRMSALREMQRIVDAAFQAAQNQLLTHDMGGDAAPLQ